MARPAPRGLLELTPQGSLSSSDPALAQDDDLLVSGAPANDRGPRRAARRQPGDRPTGGAACRQNRRYGRRARSPPRPTSPNSPPTTQVPRLVTRIAELEQRLFSSGLDAGGGGDDAAAADEHAGLLHRLGSLLKRVEKGVDAGIAFM